MAKKFKSKRKTNDLMMEVGGAIVGGAIATVAKGMLFKNVDANIQDIAVIAVGVGAPMLIDNKIVDAAGAGMIAVGGASLAQRFIPGLSGATDPAATAGLGAINETYYRGLAQPMVNGHQIFGMDEKKTDTIIPVE